MVQSDSTNRRDVDPPGDCFNLANLRWRRGFDLQHNVWNQLALRYRCMSRHLNLTWGAPSEITTLYTDATVVDA